MCFHIAKSVTVQLSLCDLSTDSAVSGLQDPGDLHFESDSLQQMLLHLGVRSMWVALILSLIVSSKCCCILGCEIHVGCTCTCATDLQPDIHHMRTKIRFWYASHIFSSLRIDQISPPCLLEVYPLDQAPSEVAMGLAQEAVLRMMSNSLPLSVSLFLCLQLSP